MPVWIFEQIDKVGWRQNC